MQDSARFSLPAIEAALPRGVGGGANVHYQPPFIWYS